MAVAFSMAIGQEVSPGALVDLTSDASVDPNTIAPLVAAIQTATAHGEASALLEDLVLIIGGTVVQQDALFIDRGDDHLLTLVFLPDGMWRVVPLGELKVWLSSHKEVDVAEERLTGTPGMQDQDVGADIRTAIDAAFGLTQAASQSNVDVDAELNSAAALLAEMLDWEAAWMESSSRASADGESAMRPQETPPMESTSGWHKEPSTASLREVVGMLRDLNRFKSAKIATSKGKDIVQFTRRANTNARISEALVAIDEMLEGFGVEVASFDFPEDAKLTSAAERYWGPISCAYVNMGDTYNRTILYCPYNGKWYVSDLGAFLTWFDEHVQEDDADQSVSESRAFGVEGLFETTASAENTRPFDEDGLVNLRFLVELLVLISKEYGDGEFPVSAILDNFEEHYGDRNHQAAWGMVAYLVQLGILERKVAARSTMGPGDTYRFTDDYRM